MYIEFRTSKLEKYYREQRERERVWGKVVARKYVEAVNLLKAVDHPSDLSAFSQFEYEQLREDRKGEHALKLGYRERLIFTVRKGSDALIARIKEVSITHYDH